MLWYSQLLSSCPHWKIGPYSVMICRFEGFSSVVQPQILDGIEVWILECWFVFSVNLWATSAEYFMSLSRWSVYMTANRFSFWMLKKQNRETSRFPMTNNKRRNDSFFIFKMKNGKQKTSFYLFTDSMFQDENLESGKASVFFGH